MKERGKAVDMDFNYSASSEVPCKKHPSSSSVGICAYCLKDRLVKLVCSDCGEQRLSSCSCSDISSYRNSSCTADVGSVGRISFLIENDKTELRQLHQKPKMGDKAAEEVIILRRSSSSCVEVKKYKGFWKIRRLFRKKKEKGCEKDGAFDDKSSDFYVPDLLGVSRSRSLCSFRGGGFNDTDDSSDYRFSSAKVSDFTGGVLFDYDKQCGVSEGESRKSGYRGALEESEGRKSGFRGLFNEAEPRKSGCRGLSDAENGTDTKGMKRLGPFELDRAYSVPHRSIFPVKESDFSAMDDSAFIDLKLDLSAESKPELPAFKINEVSDHAGSGIFRGDAYLCDGGSCRISVNDRGLKRGTNSYKVWKWLSRHYSGLRNASKKNEISVWRP